MIGRWSGFCFWSQERFSRYRYDYPYCKEVSRRCRIYANVLLHRPFIQDMVFCPKTLNFQSAATRVESSSWVLPILPCNYWVPRSRLLFSPLCRDAKELARQCGIPVVPGYSGPDQSTVRLIEEIERIGYPVLVKASMGGGGRVGEQRMIDSRECEFCRTAATSTRWSPLAEMRRSDISAIVVFWSKSSVLSARASKVSPTNSSSGNTGVWRCTGQCNPLWRARMFTSATIPEDHRRVALCLQIILLWCSFTWQTKNGVSCTHGHSS